MNHIFDGISQTLLSAIKIILRVFSIENNKAKKTIVETGYTQNGMIEIVNGLNVNQTVINEGGRIVKGGQNVKIYNNNE